MTTATKLTEPQARTLEIITRGATDYAEKVTVRRGKYVGQGIQATGFGNYAARQDGKRIKGFSGTAAFNLVTMGLVRATKHGTAITTADITKSNVGRSWSTGWIFTLAS